MCSIIGCHAVEESLELSMIIGLTMAGAEEKCSLNRVYQAATACYRSVVEFLNKFSLKKSEYCNQILYSKPGHLSESIFKILFG